MQRALVINVRFHHGRFHGVPEWPPSPARLFQALVAGASGAGKPGSSEIAALQWLEGQPPPVIAAPAMRSGQGIRSYVPNNDLDSKQGDPARVGEIRAAKMIRPRFFEVDTPLLYVWTFEEDEQAHGHALVACRVADNLYQLGRGVDMAWGWGEILDYTDSERRLALYSGAVYRPSASGSGGNALACPDRGSLQSLLARHVAQLARLEPAATRGDAKQVFTQAPKPYFKQTTYNSPPVLRLYDLIPASSPKHLVDCAELTQRIRDAAVERLTVALPDRRNEIERIFVGRESMASDKAVRIRLLPLPSIGHRHADHAVRRLLLEVPPNCPFPVNDIEWAFSGLTPDVDAETGEVHLGLVTATDSSMVTHYGVGNTNASCHWRTISAAVLPQAAARRRVDPRRTYEDVKGGAERQREQEVAAGAVLQALRHAQIDVPVDLIRVQREPFDAHGSRAEAFAAGTRFAKERMWHVEIEFARPIAGPLIIGDGRYCGLGLLAPLRDHSTDVAIFEISAESRPSASLRADVVAALRRALMSRERDISGRVSTLFSGHENDSGPARSGVHQHVYLFADDTDGDDLLDLVGIIAPWRVDRSWEPGRESRDLFERVSSGLRVVRAGEAGRLSLSPEPDSRAENLFRPSFNWHSRTDYRATRHAKRNEDVKDSVRDDLRRECLRRGLPSPEIEITETLTGPRGGVRARAHMHFKVAVAGPIMLGRDAHSGGGWFVASDQ